MTFSKENRKFPGEAALWKKSPLMQKLPNKRLKTNLIEYDIIDKNESLKIDMYCRRTTEKLRLSQKIRDEKDVKLYTIGQKKIVKIFKKIFFKTIIVLSILEKGNKYCVCFFVGKKYLKN